MSKYQIQYECGERAGWRRTEQPHPSRRTKFSGANADREMLISSVQLITRRIGTYPVDPYFAICDDHTYHIGAPEHMGNTQ